MKKKVQITCILKKIGIERSINTVYTDCLIFSGSLFHISVLLQRIPIHFQIGHSLIKQLAV